MLLSSAPSARVLLEPPLAASCLGTDQLHLLCNFLPTQELWGTGLDTETSKYFELEKIIPPFNTLQES